MDCGAMHWHAMQSDQMWSNDNEVLMSGDRHVGVEQVIEDTRVCKWTLPTSTVRQSIHSRDLC